MQSIRKKKFDFIKSMQVAHEIHSTKSAHKCGYFFVKSFINKGNGIIVFGATTIFSEITMSDSAIVTKIIEKRKMNRYCTWMNDLKSYSSLTENY